MYTKEYVPLLTLLMLEMEYSGFGVNTMPVDALAPKVAIASAGIVVNFIYSGQAKSKIRFKMWIYFVLSLKKD